ncbi:MAG: hypothetical protein ABR991_04395 [Terracidiphilus sp.]
MRFASSKPAEGEQLSLLAQQQAVELQARVGKIAEVKLELALLLEHRPLPFLERLLLHHL